MEDEDCLYLLDIYNSTVEKVKIDGNEDRLEEIAVKKKGIIVYKPDIHELLDKCKDSNAIMVYIGDDEE